MVTFCKNSDCPSSEELLAFQSGKTSGEESRRIESHLFACEFCEAELEFYAHYPQADETVARVEIPIPLLELAKALLNNKHNDFSGLNQLLCEKEGIKI